MVWKDRIVTSTASFHLIIQTWLLLLQLYVQRQIELSKGWRMLTSGERSLLSTLNLYSQQFQMSFGSIITTLVEEIQSRRNQPGEKGKLSDMCVQSGRFVLIVFCVSKVASVLFHMVIIK